MEGQARQVGQECKWWGVAFRPNPGLMVVCERTLIQPCASKERLRGVALLLCRCVGCCQRQDLVLHLCGQGLEACRCAWCVNGRVAERWWALVGAAWARGWQQRLKGLLQHQLLDESNMVNIAITYVRVLSGCDKRTVAGASARSGLNASA
jgi:hypothetical protein